MFTVKEEKAAEAEQLKFHSDLIKTKRFSIERMLIAKLDFLAWHLETLTHSDVVWLDRIEDFFLDHNYITQRQTEVLDSIIKRQVKQRAAV